MTHEGHLIITAENAAQYESLVEVIGALEVSEGTTLTAPRIICEEVAQIDAANMIRRLHERCEDIAAVRASENGFVDAVEYRMIELPGYAVRKLEGGFRG